MSDADSLARILESSAPIVSTIFGAIGVGMGGLLKFLTDRENRKIKNANTKLAKFDQLVEKVNQLEDRLKHSLDAHRAVAQECRIGNNFRNTFGVEDLSPAQINLLIQTINRTRTYSIDVLKDGKFSSYLDEDED